jgi:ATP-dependent exoDNAse (exonuclease V) beta subunit
VDVIGQSSVYDGLEYAIKKFGMADTSDAYITYFLDVVLEVEQKEGANTQAFLAYWDKKKESLSITAPENVDAVQIMTVHKSKGLEFPIVIFPYANTYIYEERDAKLWLPVNPISFKGFEEILINKKQEVVGYGPLAEEIYNTEQYKLELDAFNLLYVALTRAVKGLYVISKKDLTLKGEHKPNYYSGLFIHYLKERQLWEETKNCYGFGNLEMQVGPFQQGGQQEKITHLYTYKSRPGFRILTKAGALWDTQRGTALSKGNLLHYVMGLIETDEDIDNAIDQLVRNGDISQGDFLGMKKRIKAIADHPKLSVHFQKGNLIKNEQDILTKNGKVLRPDRLVIKDNRATIIDYKTGKRNPAYHGQVYSYADALEAMGYEIENKIIVYINEDITPEFI